jgi:hypothetical protein
MRILVEVRNGEVENIICTENCDVFIVNHDTIKRVPGSGDDMRNAYFPNITTHEEGNETPMFNEFVDDTIVESEMSMENEVTYENYN